MTDIHELLISLGSGLLLLILMSGFIGSDFVYRELAPDFVKQLPQIAQNLTPEVKEAKLYSFGDAGNNSAGATKQLASISGLGMLQEIIDSNIGSQAMSSLTKFLKSKTAEDSSVVVD